MPISEAPDTGWATRRATAGHPNTAASTLTDLATDSDWVVREAVAGHPNVPLPVLDELVRDRNMAVRVAAFRNPSRTVGGTAGGWLAETSDAE